MPDDEVCYVCGDPVEEEDLCPGCDEYICRGCDMAFPPGEHDPDIHALSAATDALAVRDDDA